MWTQFTTPKMDTRENFLSAAANGVLFGRSTFNPGVARTGMFGNGGMDATRKVATSEPLMMFNGSFGAPAKVSDTGSELRIGESHRDRARQTLAPREFIAAPFFGPGSQPQDVDRQSQFILDQSQRAVKSQGTLSDRRTNYFEQPLLPDVRAHIMKDSRFTFDAVGADTRHVFVKRLS